MFEEKDLGVIIDSELSFSEHIASGFINGRSTTAFVRPHTTVIISG